jgi:hypothetical protein
MGNDSRREMGSKWGADNDVKRRDGTQAEAYATGSRRYAGGDEI